LLPGYYTFSTIVPTIFSLKELDYSCNIFIKYIDYTSSFFNVELFPGEGGKYARSAGVFCKLISFSLRKNIVKIQLPAGVQKVISLFCMVSLGRVSNFNKKNQFFTKAGYYYYLGYKPVVRGVAMNPVDHPHGGRTKTNKPEKTPWGSIAKHKK